MAKVVKTELEKYRKLSPVWNVALTTLSIVGIGIALMNIFAFTPFGFVGFLENAYLYALMALFLSQVFLHIPASRSAPRDRIPWYDICLFGSTMAICFYFIHKSWDIIFLGWAFLAPMSMSVLALLCCILVLEAVRRAGGLILCLFTGFFAIFPLFTHYMVGPIQGNPSDFWPLVSYHILSTDSVLGLPMRVVGDLVIGFIIFAVVLQVSGGSSFFTDFATALFGNRRGGPAKVSVVSSGLFGSISGSVVANVMTTGCVTIPTMKRTGFPAHYAAAIEACASTGGMLMPPVMGTVAFIMAMFLNIDYFQIIIAAAIPSILYYFALLVQVDAYAAKVGAQGLPKSQIPQLTKTLRIGWPYIVSFLILLYYIYIRQTAQAPFYAIAFLLPITLILKRIEFSFQNLLSFGVEAGRVLGELTSILAACGFLIGAFGITGIGVTFSRELIMLAHGNIYGILALGALASYILGMGLTVSACYIFLAIVLAPGLIHAGIDIMAAHLFVLYWGVVSFITPPVAIGAYAAAGLAQANFFKTGFLAMRMGVVLYFIPFMFVLDPSLIAQGSLFDVLLTSLKAFVGIFILAGSLEGYIIGIGKLSTPLKLYFAVSAILLVFPELLTDIIGIFLILIGWSAIYLRQKHLVTV